MKSPTLRRSRSFLCSFELPFVLFVFSAGLKGIPFVALLPFDISTVMLMWSFIAGMIVILRCGLYIHGLYLIYAAVVFFLWAGISLFWSPSELYGPEKFLRMVTLDFWAIVGSALVIARSSRRLHRFLVIIIVIGTLSATVAVIQYFLWPGLNAAFRVGNYIGQSRLFSASALLAFIFWLMPRPQQENQIFLLTAFFISMFALFIAGARGPLFSLTIALLLPFTRGIVIYRKRVLLKRWAFLGAVLCLICLAILVQYALISDGTLRALARINVLITEEDGGASAGRRLEFWAKAVHFLSYSPLWGSGLGSWAIMHIAKDQRSHPHNIVLEILVELGIFGLLLFVGLLALSLFYCAAFRTWTNRDAIAAVCLFVAMLLGAMTSSDLGENRDLFASVGILATSRWRR